MSDIIIESHPGFVVLCLLVAAAYGALLYLRVKSPWSKLMNMGLLMLRATLTFLILFLLLGPIIRQVFNTFEKPVFVILQDNSRSIKEATDSSFRTRLGENVLQIRNALEQNGYDAPVHDLTGEEVDAFVFTENTSAIQEALRGVVNRYEGNSIAGVLLLSDGIYNSGLSPLYSTYNFPVHAVGIGDTTERMDIVLKNLEYNKIAYQGNKFPLRAEIVVKGYANDAVAVSLLRGGKVLERQSKPVIKDQLIVVEFSQQAIEQGLQRYDVQVEVKEGESNNRNNRATAFVEVVEGKKKILMIAAAPHPDVKAVRSVVEKNPNYEFLLHIPGVEETDEKFLRPENVDLVILHQVPDKRGRTRELMQRFMTSRTSIFLIAGQQTDLALFNQQNPILRFEQPPRQFDDVTPVINNTFSNFTFSEDVATTFATFPPVWVPFAKVLPSPAASVLLYQKVGSLATDKPLLWVEAIDERKTGVLLADGFWQWRLHEFSKAENTDSFDEVIGKLIQYLSTAEDKSKFKSYPIQQQFTDTEAVVFESQVFNDIYEPVFGYPITIDLVDERGRKFTYSYVTSQGNTRYQIGGLSEGVYRYESSTSVNNKKEIVRGQFLVASQQVELQNLTADFDLLRKLSVATGGNFYRADELEKAKRDLTSQKAQATIHTDEKFDALLNLKWVFFLLVCLISVEWFIRKYQGSY